jgi:hypothetical protein
MAGRSTWPKKKCWQTSSRSTRSGQRRRSAGSCAGYAPYQIPRFGSEKEKAEQLEADFGLPEAAAAKGAKPSFPAGDSEQTALVIDALIEAGGFADAAVIAAPFKQGQKVRPAVAAVLTSLYRMGLVSTVDGKSFAWRRAA